MHIQATGTSEYAKTYLHQEMNYSRAVKCKQNNPSVSPVKTATLQASSSGSDLDRIKESYGELDDNYSNTPKNS